MFRKILVPLDGSELAEEALEPALSLAEKADGEILLLSVAVQDFALARSRPGLGMDLVEELTTHSRERLNGYLASVQKAQASSPVTFRCKVEEGDAAGVIVDTAAAEDADLIVMSTHGRSGISRWLMGSVTERVLRGAPCPVLAVRGDVTLEHILITLDGSKLSESALEPGLAMAGLLDGRVTLLSVESPVAVAPSLVTDLEAAEAGLGTRVRNEFYHQTGDYLRGVAASCRESLGRDVDIAPRTGNVAPAILDYVESKKVDLVAMATHGRTGLRRWVYGSVTEKVLRKAECAMLVVRPPDEALKQ
jgi:nucleotide-binding universal stress UspA family protein